MPQDNSTYVHSGLKLLQEALTPFVEGRLESRLKGFWQIEVSDRIPSLKNLVEDGKIRWDVAALLKVMWNWKLWKDAFNDLKEPAHSYVGVLTVARNRLAHQANFTDKEVTHALDTMNLLLKEIGKKDAGMQEFIDKIENLRQEMTPNPPQETQENEEGVPDPYYRPSDDWPSYYPKMW